MKKARSNWQDVVLVCRKCSRKLDGGFGPKGKASLRKALRKGLKLKRGRHASVGVVEVDCLKLCPKDAVTIVLVSDPGRFRTAPRGSDIKEIVGELGLGPAARLVPDTAAPAPETSR